MRDRLLAAVRERPLVLHPLLFAAFPVVFLFAANVRYQIPAGTVLTALAVVVGSAAVFLLIGTLVLGSSRRAGLIVSAWVLLFFSYGHVWNAVRSTLPGREALLLGLWAVLAAGAVVLAARRGPRLGGITRALNTTAAVLVAANLVSASISAIASGGQMVSDAGPNVDLRRPPDTAAMPDIYYIVMDRYGARSTLQKLGFDNEVFLDGLRERGFYVATRSVANYPKTSHSLAASLNMRYLGFLTKQAGTGSDDWNPVYALLRDSRVTRALQGIGYRYVHVGSRWDPTREDPAADLNLQSDTMSEFSQVLFQTTLLGGLARQTGLLSRSLDARERERARVLFQFEALARVSRMAEPTFTFAHLLLPHEPYLFEADGSSVTEEEEASRTFEENFVNQIRFANQKLDELLDTLLEGPESERPVVILQADEGPHPAAYVGDEVGFNWPSATDDQLERKFLILNAYYLPGPAGLAPYPEISPVNSFRVVLDRYLDAGLPLVPDRSYVFVDERHLYDFVDVTARLTA